MTPSHADFPDYKEKFIYLCANIFAHASLDMEITLNGRGTNSTEAENVAVEILKIIGLKPKDICKRIHQIEKVLKEEYE